MRESLGGIGLLAPTVLILIGLVLYPFFYAIWLAFTDKTVGSPGQFVGFKNFAYVLAWPQFGTAVWNTVVFTVSAVALKFVLGMAVALVLNQRIRGRNFFRAFLLLPWAMPAFVVYLVWRWLYDPLSGLINYALIDLGLIATPIAFLSDRSTAMFSVVIAHGKSRNARKKLRPRIPWLSTSATAMPRTNFRATAETVKTTVFQTAVLNCGHART